MVKSKTQRIRASICKSELGTYVPLGQTLRVARKTMGLYPNHMAQLLHIPADEWTAYEQSKKLIPAHVILKLVLFGMDFWCKNRESFVPACAGMTDTDTPSPAVPPLLPEGN